MFKTGLKAFVFSFSVSLFAILAAHRAFLHKSPSVSEPLHINERNIVLFLKNAVPLKSPTQKVTLAALPDIPAVPLETPQNQETEVILANNFDDVDVPLEIISEDAVTKELTVANSEPLVTADILYAPDLPEAELKIEEEPIYKPDDSALPRLAPPSASAKVVAGAPALKPQKLAENKPKEEVGGKMMRNDVVPLKKTARSLGENRYMVKGDPDEMNHVAMGNVDVPIESMTKAEKAEVQREKEHQKKWKSLDDEKWLVARANAGSKNLFVKEKAEKNKEEVEAAFLEKMRVNGVQVAAEGGVDNLMIPLKDELKDPNLVPKLAYPSSSEDAIKEKQMAEEEKKEKVLSPIEEDDLSLDAPKQDGDTGPKEKSENKEEGKSSLLSRLNSMISGSTKNLAEAKDKAIAKAQARRSLK